MQRAATGELTKRRRRVIAGMGEATQVRSVVLNIRQAQGLILALSIAIISAQRTRDDAIQAPGLDPAWQGLALLVDLARYR